MKIKLENYFWKIAFEKKVWVFKTRKGKKTSKRWQNGRLKIFEGQTKYFERLECQNYNFANPSNQPLNKESKTKRWMLWRDPCDNHWSVNSGNTIFKGLFSFFLPCVPIENRHVVRYFVDTVLDPPLPSEKRHVNFSDSIACTWSASFLLIFFSGVLHISAREPNFLL